MMKKTKKYLFPILMVILIAIVVFFLYPSVWFKDNDFFEKDQQYSARSLISFCIGDVTLESEYLDTREVGDNVIIYHVEKGIFHRDIPFRYEVKDTTPPVITIKDELIEKQAGDLCSLQEMIQNVSLNEGSFVLEDDYDPDYPGTYTVQVLAEDIYHNTSRSSFIIQVVDTEEPFVMRTGSQIKILLGSDFNIMNYLSYGDNVDGSPKLEIEGEVDTSQLGTYPLHASLSDFSGNVQQWDISVEVIDSFTQQESEEYRYPFERFIDEYAGENREFGIDVSSWQNQIDFQKVKDAGCDFVIIRLGWCFEGELHIDKYFHDNLQAAKEAGIKTGAYLFCYEYSKDDLSGSLQQVFAELENIELELPLIFDWENFQNYQEYEISFLKLNRLYDLFEEETILHGYQSMLYGSKFYLETIWKQTDIRPIWLAQYNDWPTYTGPYKIWQLCDFGEIEGIDGPVDFNILFTDR